MFELIRFITAHRGRLNHRVGAAALAAVALMLLLASPASAAAGATITVNNSSNVIVDDGACTLSEAIIAANTNTASGAMTGECAAGTAGLDHIVFTVSSITLGNDLPEITAPVIIDGGVSKVQLHGGGGTETLGFNFEVGSKGSTLTNFKIGDFPVGVGVVLRGGGVTLTDNWIGTINGTSSAQNFAGVKVLNPISSGNKIGLAGHGNLISGNITGVEIAEGTGNLIQGNLIGTSADGGSALQNGAEGILLDGTSSKTTIGGTKAGQGNVISGSSDGIVIDPGIASTKIMRNFFGTDINGLVALANGNAIHDKGGVGTVVGGSMPSASNLFAGNGFGVRVAGTTPTSSITISGNTFGLGADGLALPNGYGVVSFDIEKVTVKGNLIAHTTNQGIEFDGSAPVLGKGSTNNCITGNGLGALNASAVTLNLASNWWGKATGPNTAGADPTNGPFTTAKYLTKPPTSCLGWAPKSFKPANASFAAKNTKVTKFSWGKVPTADDYDFTAYTYDDVTTTQTPVVAVTATGGPTSFTTAAPLDYGRYFWNTWTHTPDQIGWTSAQHVFYVTIMKSPKQGAVVKAGDIKFSWGAANPLPADYSWELFNDANCFYDTTFNNMLGHVTPITGLTTTQSIIAAGNYWWSVSPNGGAQMDCWPITVTP